MRSMDTISTWSITVFTFLTVRGQQLENMLCSSFRYYLNDRYGRFSRANFTDGFGIHLSYPPYLQGILTNPVISGKLFRLMLD